LLFYIEEVRGIERLAAPSDSEEEAPRMAPEAACRGL
jgi:hypothetical protein